MELDFDNMDYEEFYMSRLSSKARPVTFTKDEIVWAIEHTEYKYFGSYEFTQQQQMAVDILVWASDNYIKFLESIDK